MKPDNLLKSYIISHKALFEQGNDIRREMTAKFTEEHIKSLRVPLKTTKRTATTALPATISEKLPRKEPTPKSSNSNDSKS